MFQTTRPASADSVMESSGFHLSFWKKVFQKAKDLEASDIHAESLEKGLFIRFRVRGDLRDFCPPVEDKEDMVQHMDTLKEIAGLDTSEKRCLQDGSFSLSSTRATYRISLSPGFQYGECAVMRIIDHEAIPSLGEIGLSPSFEEDLKSCLTQKQGLILVTGPTGSGKSTTLQAAIAAMEAKTRKIISIEDPPERILDGVVHEKVTKRYSWACAIKGAMRQDPDVLLVGEIRDSASAHLAAEAAQTGHLVLSTLHTNSVPETLGRLFTLGVAPHMVAGSLLFASAQRLLGRLCPGCKKPVKGGCTQGLGCTLCGGSGLTGRIPVTEYAVKPPAELILNGKPEALEKLLKTSLAEETRRLVEEGLVDPRNLILTGGPL